MIILDDVSVGTVLVVVVTPSGLVEFYFTGFWIVDKQYILICNIFCKN